MTGKRKESPRYMSYQEVMKTLGVGRNKAYQIISSLNAELEKLGLIIINGRVNRQYFEEKFFYKGK